MSMNKAQNQAGLYSNRMAFSYHYKRPVKVTSCKGRLAICQHPAQCKNLTHATGNTLGSRSPSIAKFFNFDYSCDWHELEVGPIWEGYQVSS